MTHVYGHGFFTTPSSSGNTVYVGCRSGLCAGSGWLIDHKGSFGDAAARHGSGVQGMTDRLAALGGTLRIASRPGHGTTVTGLLPVPGPRAPGRPQPTAASSW